MARTLVWTGNAGDGNFDNAGNWNDVTDGLNPAATPPTSIDFVQFAAAAGGTVGGVGQAGSLDFYGGGTWTFTGSTSVAGAIDVGANTGEVGDLVIAAGASVTDTEPSQSSTYLVQIGTFGQGAVTVTGAGAVLNTDDNPLQLGGGSGGSGSLTISDGGTVEAGSANSDTGDAALSLGRIGSATVVVNGAGSSLQVVGFTYVARSGSASVLVENDATMTVSTDASGQGGLTVGQGSSQSQQPIGGSGTLTVTSGGSLTSTQFIDVGGDGEFGTMTVEDGGIVDVGTELAVGLATSISGVTYGGNGTLTIGAGGTVDITATPSSSALAVAAGTANNGAANGASFGMITVTGAGAVLNTNGGQVGIGIGGSGVLSITQGGSVLVGTPNSSQGAALSAGRLGSGDILVSDPGSSLTADGFVYIGAAGAGSLLIENDATMTVALDPTGSGSMSIGGAGNSTSTTVRVGGTGTATVETGGVLKVAQTLNVGTNGTTGSLDIENTGTVDVAGRILIGNSLTVAAGTTIVTETGTTVASAPMIFNGDGTITVDAGGLLESDGPDITGDSSIVVGSSAGSTGTLDVTGAGAVANGGGDRIGIGANGTGTMLVSQGGLAESGADYTDAEAAAFLGANAGSVGTLTVTDAGSTFAAAGLFEVGEAGTGTLLVENGGTVTADGMDIGETLGGFGTVAVDGVGSLLSIDGDLNVGVAGGAALSIGGGEVTVTGNVTVGVQATVTGTGGTVDPVDYTNAGTTSGALAIDATTAIVNTGTFIATGGTLELDGTVGGPGGLLTIGDGGTLKLDDGVTGQALDFATTSGVLTIQDLAGFAATPISGFAAGDMIAAPGAGIASLHYDAATDILTLDNADGTALAALQFAGTYTQNEFTLNDDTIGLLCFLPGALIATPGGEVAVERLAVGDAVTVLSGAVRRIAWIGTGRVLATRGRRNAATPIVVRRGALADNVPHRDLRITKGHSFLLDGALIPAEFLVNHRSIQWDDEAGEVELFHVELDSHDVLLANGAPAESYRDDGNRWLFRNANSGWDRPPVPPCAPVLTGGALVDAVWRRLLDRAGPCPPIALTGEADVHLLADGVRVDAATLVNGAHIFRLGSTPRELRIVSRAAAPAALGLARDPRLLGVAVARVAMREGSRFRTMQADDARLDRGFHGYEPACGFRWTDGDAVLPPELWDGLPSGAELVLHIAATARYPAPVAGAVAGTVAGAVSGEVRQAA